LKTSGRVVTSGRVLKQRSPTNTGVVCAGGVANERLKPISRVVATGVVFERLSASGRIPTGSCRAIERASAKSRVVGTGGDTSEGSCPLSRIRVAQVSFGECSYCRRKPKAAEYEWNEKERAP
jgi:hypothetical protein